MAEDMPVKKEMMSPKQEDVQSLELQFEKIIGVTTDPGELTFAIKFKGKEKMEFIPARIANFRYPEKVIEYYEERLVWETAPRKYERVKLSRKSDKKPLCNGNIA